MKAADLTDMGVPASLANAYTTATAPTVTIVQPKSNAAPQTVSEHGQGGGSTQGPGPNTSIGQPPVGTDPYGGIEKPGDVAADPYNKTDSSPGGTTSSGPAQDPHQLDWEQALLAWGFTQAEIDTFYATYTAYGSDIQGGQKAVLALARNSDTYKRLFPGIQQGEKTGLFTDEQGYRNYVASLNEVSNRLQGRGVTTQEVVDWINQGRAPGQFEQHLNGQAYIAANRNDIQYALGNFGSGTEGQASDADLSSLGDNTSGLSNITGVMLQKKLEVARSRLNDIFQGTLATPSLAVLNNGRVAQSGTGGTPADVAS